MSRMKISKTWKLITSGTAFILIAASLLIMYAATASHALSKATSANHLYFGKLLDTGDNLFLSKVYVLSSGEIVAEKPSDTVVNSQDPAAQASKNNAVSIKASFTVAATRFIVVDENDIIVEIWSNVRGSNCSDYCLQVKYLNRQGAAHPITEGILDQYNQLLEKVDWDTTGKVYCIQSKH